MSGEQADSELTNEEKIRAYEDFKQHLFWKACMVPVVNALIAQLTIDLRTCALKDVVRTRSRIEAFETLLDIPEQIRSSADDDLLIEQYLRQEEDQQEGNK